MSSIVGPVSPSAGGGGGNVIDTLQSTLGAGDRTGSASGILVDDGDVLAMASGAFIRFSSNSNPGGLPDIIIGRSGVSSLALTNPITSGPANLTVGDLTVLGSHNITGGASTSVSSTGILLGPTSPVLSGVELRSDENGSLIIVGHGSASASDSSIKVRYIRAPFDGNEVDISINNQLAMAVTSGEVSIGSSSRNVALIDSTYRYVLTPNRYWGEEAGRGGLLFGSGLSLMWSSVEDMSSFAPTDLDSAIVRSGVGSLALTNPSTSGPASLTVGDLTVLGTHNITGGGGSSSTIYPTGLVIGAETASGTMLASDLNGALILRDGGGIGPSLIRLGPELIIGPSGNGNALAVSGINGGADISCRDIYIRDVNTSVVRAASVLAKAGGITYYSNDFSITNNINYESIKLNGDAGICWSADSATHPAAFSVASIGILPSGSYTKLALFNPETKSPAQLLLSNTACQIASSGSISGDLRIDMQGAKVQTFSVSTTGLFTPYNLSYLSSEKQLFVTAVGTVGVTFDSSIKWLGSRPATLGSGVTYMFSLMNYSPTQIVASYEALSDG